MNTPPYSIARRVACCAKIDPSFQGFRRALLVALVAGAAACSGRRSTIPPPFPGTVVRAPSPPAATRRLRVPGMGTAQFRVCAFGFHSPDELAAIRSQLPATDFAFTDLTPAGAENTAAMPPLSAPAPASSSTSAPTWLMDRCRPDLRCDIVVYSGEFAGGFFGNYGISLTVQEMEEAACQPRCQGLFHDAREVFLLGCNTLATKSADNRTPEVYRQVLLTHGFSRSDAERVVDLRYGPLGPSFAESLRRIFMGVPRIYGFSSVAPTAEVTVPRLYEYFRRKGDYAHYLTRAARDRAPNQELLASFTGTSLMQTTGLTVLDNAAADRASLCRLYDDTQTLSDRLHIAQRLLARSDFLSFVPTVEVFFSRHPPEQLQVGERQLLRGIQLLEAPRRQMTDLMYRLNVSAFKMQMAHLALQLAWITTDEYRRLAVQSAEQLLSEPLSSEVADIACDMAKYAPAGAGLRSEQIPEQLLLHPEGFRLLDCLSPTDARVSIRLLAGLQSIDESTRLWAAYALSHRLPLDDAVQAVLARHLTDSSVGVRERVQWIFKVQPPRSPLVFAAIREHDPLLAQALQTEAIGNQ